MTVPQARRLTDADVIDRLADPVGFDRLLAALSLSDLTTFRKDLAMDTSEQDKLQAELNDLAREIRDAEGQIRQHEMRIENLEAFAHQKRLRRDAILAMK